MNNNSEIENPFEFPSLPTEIEEKNISTDIPRWPAGPPTQTKGEFGTGDKAHQERAKEEGKALGHPAIDIVYPIGTPIYAMLPGKVIYVNIEAKPWKPGSGHKEGNAIKIDHPKYGLTSFYAHLSSVSVSVGQEVDQNTQIGTVGTSGNARYTRQEVDGIEYGHVHFEVKKNGQPVNPRKIISGTPIKTIVANRENRKQILKTLSKEALYKNKFWEDEDD